MTHTVTSTIGLLQKAMSLHQLGKLSEAKNLYKKILKTDRNNVTALHMLGVVQLAEGNPAHAHESIARAFKLAPDYFEAAINLGNTLRSLDRPKEAMSFYERAIELNPTTVDGHYNLGVAQQECGQLDDALRSYQRVIALNPSHAEARSNAALLYLQRGDFARGWALYESRFETPQYKLSHPTLPGSRWDGKTPLVSKRLLIACEQGLGDTIQFSRYIPLIKRRAPSAEITVLVKRSLHRILGRLAADVAFVDDTGGARFDFHLPLMSAPFIFKTEIESIPSGSEPYLTVDPTWIATWMSALHTTSEPPARLKIGLMWRSGNVTPIKGRSIELTALTSLLNLPIDIVSLQIDVPTAEAARIKTQSNVRHFGRPFRDGRLQADFADAAALISCVDWVVTVDTSIAHLSSALGKETWILLPKNCDWRWLDRHTNSPWYPRARLFRQQVDGDWSVPLGEIYAETTRRLKVRNVTDASTR